jgi:hypothetical protein
MKYSAVVIAVQGRVMLTLPLFLYFVSRNVTERVEVEPHTF